jgi:hypothetical protein
MIGLGFLFPLTMRVDSLNRILTSLERSLNSQAFLGVKR